MSVNVTRTKTTVNVTRRNTDNATTSDERPTVAVTVTRGQSATTTMMGPRGLTGAKGDTGPQGEKGDKGDTGERGPAGRNVESAEVLGDNLILHMNDATDIDAGHVVGPKGDTGAKGDTGGQGPKGDRGDVGPQGLQGFQGNTGPRGEKGDQGAVGPGLAAGGATGQVARKKTGADFDTEWHTLTQSDVGLANVDNTSDASKPVSAATQAALNTKSDLGHTHPFSALTGTPTTLAGYGITDAINTSSAGAAGGVATLGADGKIPTSQLNPVAITSVFTAASDAEMLALVTQEGDLVIRSDQNKSYIRNAGTSGTIADFTGLLTPTDTVLSVNGQAGTVNLSKADLGLSNVDNTSDVNKPISAATQAALDGKQPVGNYASLSGASFSGDVGTTGLLIRPVGRAANVEFDGSGFDGARKFIASQGVVGITNDGWSLYDATASQNRIEVYGDGRVRIPGILDAGPAVRVGGYETWHAGNFNPAYKLDYPFPPNIWLTSAEGWNRLYFANGGHTYISSPGDLRFQTGSGIDAFAIDQTGSIAMIGAIRPAIPPIRLTPNLHLNAADGTSAVILNWDNGASATNQQLRIGNGAGADTMYVRADGHIWSSQYGFLSDAFAAAGSRSRLYRSDGPDNYSVRTWWTGSYWRLTGYYPDDSFHGETSVGHADTADNANNAATLGGLSPSTAAAAGTIAQRTDNGYLNAVYFNQSSPSNENPPFNEVFVGLGDGYLRKASHQHFANTLGGLAVTGSGIRQFNNSGRGTVNAGVQSTLQAFSDDANSAAMMSFHRSAIYAVNMGLDTDNIFKIGGWSAAADRLTLDMNGHMKVAGNLCTGSGVVYLGAPSDKYLQHNGTEYLFGGSYGIHVGGSATIGGNISAHDIVADRGDGTGVLYLTAPSNSRYLYWDGSQFILQGGSLNVAAGNISTAGSISAAGNITASGDVTAFSDARLKSNIRTIGGALDLVDQLRGVRFDKDGRESIGVVAQEVREVLPEVVHEDDEGYLSVAYGNMTGLLIEGMKELRTENQALRDELAQLRMEIRAIREERK